MSNGEQCRVVERLAGQPAERRAGGHDERNAARRALLEQIATDRDVIFRVMRTLCATEWPGVDLTLPQLRVLHILEHHDGLSMTQLAEALGKAQATVTGLVDRLVESGLVTRFEQPTDRRITIARLTDSGRATLANLALSGDAHTNLLLGRLDQEELAVIAAAFAIMRREASRLLAAADPALPA